MAEGLCSKRSLRDKSKEGSAAAAARLKAREDEKSQVEATLRRLRVRLERGKVRISEEVFADAIERLKGNLEKGSIQKRRGVLRTFMKKIEVGKKRGTL